MKSIMKRFLTLALVLTLAFTMTSCDIVFDILDAFLGEETGVMDGTEGGDERVDVTVLPDAEKEGSSDSSSGEDSSSSSGGGTSDSSSSEDSSNSSLEEDASISYEGLYSGYNFTPATGEDKVWEVESLWDIDRAFDYVIASCQESVTIDFANVMGGYESVDDFFKNGYLPNAQKELGYIESYGYSYKGTTATFVLNYNKSVASYVLDETDENNYENYKNGNMVLRDKADGEATRAADFDDFAINKNNNGTMAVYNSEALWWALEHNYLPTFPQENTKAEAFYNTAKSILREIINDDMTDYEKIRAIFEYLVDMVDYDYDALYETQTSSSNNNVCYYLEGVFEYNRAVCDGKSKAFVLLCRIEGIEALRDWGDSYTGGAGHAWNYVKLDGVWYMVDTTAGDGGVIFNSGEEKAEVVDYSYFLCGVDSYKLGVATGEAYEYSGVWAGAVSGSADISDQYYISVDLEGDYDFHVDTYAELNYLVDTLAGEMAGYSGKYTLKFTASGSYNTEAIYKNLINASEGESIKFGLYDYTDRGGFYLVVFENTDV